VLAFEVVDDEGKTSVNGSYIVGVSSQKVQVYEPNALTVVSERVLDVPGTAATVTDWGALVIIQAGVILVLPLPGIQVKGQKIELPTGRAVTMIPRRGAAAILEESVTFWVPVGDEALLEENRRELSEPAVKRALGKISSVMFPRD
jgi:hypothetical protein